MMMGSNAGGSGEQERPTVTARARAVFTRARTALAAAITRAEATLAAFPPTRPAITRVQARRAARRAARAAYDQARAAYKEARKANAHARAYDHARTYAHVRAYVSLAVKGSGLLALLLSTVVLLGGYVQSLGNRDFFCVMAISAIQAAGIFHDWETNLQYLNDFEQTFMVLLNKYNLMVGNFTVKGLLLSYYFSPVVVPTMVLIWCVYLLFLVGPLACAAISLWRIVKFNHGNNRDGTDSMVHMMAAMNIFYSLVIFQGIMFFVLLDYMVRWEAVMARHLHSLEQLSDKWGKEAIQRYLSHVSTKCRKDPLSIKGLDMIKYAAELLDSESQEDYLYGARLLSVFIKKGKDVSWVLLCSRQRIQKLVDSLWISSSHGSIDESNIEIRELAATIVADLAGHIDVARYPGAMRYISSLLQETYWNSSKQACHPQPPPREPGLFEILFQSKKKKMKHLTILEEKRQWRLMRDQKRLGTSQERRRQNSEGHTTTSNELILQGLTILERLASNNDNRKLICSTPGLIPKITAPLYSENLTQDVKIKAWADIVTRCLKVLYQLIRSPGQPSRRLRPQIFSNYQALSNLKSILLEVGNDEADHHQELQMVAMKILTELALDLSVNLSEETKKVLVIKQLQLFLLANGDGEKESATIAGRALVSLSANNESYFALIMTMKIDITGHNSESNSALIMTTERDITGHNSESDITGRHLTEILTEILEGNDITRRTIAAQIMANLCAHYNVNNMKQILTKVLKEIMATKRKSQERRVSSGQNNPALGDEENQGNSVSTNNEGSHRFSCMLCVLPKWCSGILITMGILQQSPTETQEISDLEREEQEAFLSLAQVICDKLNSTDMDGAIQDTVQNENNERSEDQQRETFVDKLKTIIDDNCHPAADSLRIVKLCGQIAKSVMRCEQYVEIFRNKGFKSSLSEASKTMSELESCMLFGGTDFGPNKRPLFSEIEESFGHI